MHGNHEGWGEKGLDVDNVGQNQTNHMILTLEDFNPQALVVLYE